MKKITGTFPSSTGLCDIHFYFYVPEKPKALLMLSHGMCEYIERYKDFARFLCENDIILCGNDHIGHGNSITSDDMLGYFGLNKGYIHMVSDLHRMKLAAEKLYPDIPHFLMGHSMGSFLARIYFSKYGDRWSGAIFMGTAGGIFTSQPCSIYFMQAVRTPCPYSPIGSMPPLRNSMGVSVGVFSTTGALLQHSRALSKSL